MRLTWRFGICEIRMKCGQQGHIIEAVLAVMAERTKELKCGARSRLPLKVIRQPFVTISLSLVTQLDAIHHERLSPSSSTTALQPCEIVDVQAYRPAIFGLLIAYQFLDLRLPCMTSGYNVSVDTADKAIDHRKIPSDGTLVPRGPNHNTRSSCSHQNEATLQTSLSQEFHTSSSV